MSKREAVGFYDKTNFKAERLSKRYAPYFKALDKSILGRTKGINQYDHIALGEQLQSYEIMQMIMEADGSVASLGPLPKIALDVITAQYGISPLPQICGIQPIDEPVGLVWFKNYVAQTTRGNVTEGDYLISTLATPNSFPNGFASDTQTAMFINDVSASGGQQYASVPLSPQAFNAPIDPQRITIFGSTKFNTNADAVTWPKMPVDPDSLEFFGSQVVNGNMYSCYGTVNTDNGQVSLQFSAAPSSQTYMSATFAALQEAGTDLQKAIMQLQAAVVQSAFYSLKSTFGFFEAYMMNKRWSMSAEDEMTKDLAALINQEIFNKVLAQLVGNVPSTNNATAWGRQPQSGVDYYTHGLSLPAAMTDASTKITKYAGRGSAKTWICGLQACAIVETLPGFKKLFNDDTLGPHVFGTFREWTIVRVPYSSLLDDYTMIGVHKGNTPFENAAVWAPYMPLTTTELMGTGANPLQRQKAAAAAGAAQLLIPNFLCQVTINPYGFNYGAGPAGP